VGSDDRAVYLLLYSSNIDCSPYIIIISMIIFIIITIIIIIINLHIVALLVIYIIFSRLQNALTLLL